MVGVVEMLRAVVEGKPGRRGRQGPGMRWHSETGEQSSEVVYGQIGLSNVDFAHQARPGINVMDDLSLNVSAGRGTDGFNGELILIHLLRLLEYDAASSEGSKCRRLLEWCARMTSSSWSCLKIAIQILKVTRRKLLRLRGGPS